MSSPVPVERFRKPAQPPTRLQLENAQAWEDFQNQGIADVKASATKWRDGLAALVGVITGALVVSGPDAISHLGSPWRYVATGLVFAGYGAAVIGLWLALKAAAGSPVTVSLADPSMSRYSLRDLEVIRAVADARRLRCARGFVMAALILLWLGTLTWWAAPTEKKVGSFDNRVRITLINHDTVCGTLRDTTPTALVLRITGHTSTSELPLNQVWSIQAGKC